MAYDADVFFSAWRKKKTKHDKLKSMTAEELAKFFTRKSTSFCPPEHPHCDEDCYVCWLRWLGSEESYGLI